MRAIAVLIFLTTTMVAIGGPAGAAESPTAAQILAYKPAQSGVSITTPEKATLEQCKVEVATRPSSGYVLRDPRGLILRRFVDTNRDGALDVYSFFENGQEVYRERDTDGNRKPDEYCWFHGQGGKRGVDRDGDGAIDQWTRLSAEEATAEVVAALATRDLARLERVMISDADLKTLGVGKDAAERVAKARQAAAAKFQQATANFSATAKWTGFDGNLPAAVPADDGETNDIVVYQNATILVDIEGKTQWLRAEIVRVGDTWKLCDVPAAIDAEKAVELAGILVPAIDQGNGAGQEEAPAEASEKARRLVADLQKLDQAIPNEGESKELAAYHVKRAGLCAKIGAEATKLAGQEHWYKQVADSLNAAVQTGEYPQGITALSQYGSQLAKTTWGKDIAAYFQYRAVNASYAEELGKPGANQQKAQEKFLGELSQFLADYPEADDAPDALLQLGNGKEFAGKESDAIDSYKKLVAKFPKSTAQAKATGSLRRLLANGQLIELVGGSLTGNETINVGRLQGKVLIVNYWSTWCEPCKAEMPHLAKLKEKHANDLEIVGVCVDSNKKAAIDYVTKNGIDWPNLFEEGAMESAPVVQYGVISLPFVMLVDGEGRILNHNLQFNQIDVEVEKAIARKIATKKR